MPEVWKGIRARVTAVATLVVVGVLVVAAVALVTSQRQILTEDLDEALIADAEQVAEEVDAGSVSEPLVPRADDDSVVQVVDGAGEVVVASANYASFPPLPPPSPNASQHVRNVRLFPDEPSYRLVSVRRDAMVVHVAAPTDDIDESVGALRLGLAVAIPVVAACLAALIWWLVGRTLRPVEAIRREVDDISGHQLDRRLPEPPGDDEIVRLARTMNAMLDRIERAGSSQRRFVADASHELRTPLTRIRTAIEVDLAHPAHADVGLTQQSVLDEATRLQRLVEDLLVLARHDDGPAARTAGRPVDLDDIVMGEADKLRSISPGVRIDAAQVSAAQVAGDPDQLTRLVRNLMDNAARHAHSVVVVGLGERAGRAVLTVADDGTGIPPDQRERVFDRFTRLDEARSGDDGGSGLGLAIARSIAERHGGTIRVDPGHAPGARLVVELPLLDERGEDFTGGPRPSH